MLEEKYHLTALELLQELQEDGRHAQALRLRSFFSDPAFFPPDLVARASSSPPGTTICPFLFCPSSRFFSPPDGRSRSVSLTHVPPLLAGWISRVFCSNCDLAFSDRPPFSMIGFEMNLLPCSCAVLNLSCSSVMQCIGILCKEYYLQ
uniref:Uncharacterized protein n=1 Tax=Aegilops tauschii subsp. strangulata TaxID=200361 RepID=A0A453ETY5_AEGTS